MRKKTGKQIIPIENPDLINVLKTYLSTHKNNEYLLMRNDEGLDKKDIENIMRDEIGKNMIYLLVHVHCGIYLVVI